jgi:2,3-bisphosphoglycerate-independent phosphoglycerate mutase
MKYLVIIANGLTDDLVAERDNKTPLQLADTPNLDRLAEKGRTGSVRTIPESLHAGNDVSFLSLLGYAPEQYHASPAFFESLALGVKLNEGEMPLCCDFISLQSSHNDMVMKDFTAGQLSADDSNLLLEALQKQISEPPVTFHAGGGYHNLMVAKSQSVVDMHTGRLTPPNELIGEGIRRHMPDKSKELVHIITQAQIILHNHIYNKEKRKTGKDLVNSIWLWGNGKAPVLPSFASRFQKSASMITASNLFKGMGLSAGINVAPVQGATGFVNTNYQGKVETALRELDSQDAVFLQVSASEFASLHGNIDDKIMAIEDFDNKILGPILSALTSQKNVKILLAVNHVSSVVHMKYTKDAVPFVVYPARLGADSVKQFDENILKGGSGHFGDGPALVEALFKGEL